MNSASEKHILIVDDDEVFRTRISSAFSKRGFVPYQCDSFSTGVLAVSNMRFNFALIDLKLPDGSGIDILKPLLLTSPDCKAVIFTGYGTISTAVNSIKSGAVNYLTKPATIDEILDRLLSVQNIPDNSTSKDIPTPSLSQIEWEHIQNVLEKCGGNISHAAKELGMHRRSLQRKLSKEPGRLT